MKQLLAILFLATASLSSFAQGTLIFNNRTSRGDYPIKRPDGSGAGAGLTAQLYLVGNGGVLTPLTPTTTFRTSSPAAAYFVNEINPFVVNGILPGQPVTLRLRVWETAAGSYDAATAGNFLRGDSHDFTIAQLGGTPAGGAPIPPPGLDGLAITPIPVGMTLVPEPSTIALGLLGALAFLFRRKR